ncbi:MAG: MCE family protein [Mycobacteriaceae bacterium]|nr:MCE family protein [Mycobacteriaceae bacterium]
MTAPVNTPRTPPLKMAGAVLLVLSIAVVVVIYFQFRGDFTPKTQLTMISARSGLSMDPGTKVTYNGVEIGRVAKIDEIQRNGEPQAKFTLDVDPKYIKLIPANVDANIKATTVFGNKYVSFTSPKNPAPQRISPKDVIDVTAVTTEFNTLFETVVSISEKVDPVKLNETLTAAAQALDGLGDRFGRSIEHGNQILADVNPRQPQVRYDIQKLADLADVYANASPDLWNALDNAVTTARTLNDQRSNLDSALMSSVGFGNTGADVFNRGGPYLVRGAQDLIPTSQLLDEYSPALFCTVRKFHDVAPKIAESLGGNGYSLRTHSEVLGASNAYVYPDNLPRVNAHGGPEGRPGCWQDVNKDLWPAPYLVMDTGASIAPYNHLGLASPFGCAALPPCILPIAAGPIIAAAPLFIPGIEYVWGRQFGENTINP